MNAFDEKPMQDIMRNFIHRIVRRWKFGSLQPNADGWYIWRNSATWPKNSYRCVEVAIGVMVDKEPIDSYNADWRLIECEPYGQFRGPILSR